MYKRRLGQFCVSFLIALSLFASSVSACVCLHHAEKTETEVSSCHEHSKTKHESETAENVFQLNSDEDCGCLQPAPKVFAKSEIIKLAKQTAISPVSQIEFKIISTFVPSAQIHFEKPFYLSDSFYNIKSPRAPPAA